MAASRTQPPDEDNAVTRQQRSHRAHQEFICLGMLKNIVERRGIDFVTVDDLRCLEAVLISSLRFDDHTNVPPGFQHSPAGREADQFRAIIFGLPWLLRKELVEFFDSEPLEHNPYLERFRRGLENGNMRSTGARASSMFIDPQTGRLRVRQRPEIRVYRGETQV
ncbi:hypothetical protein DIZ76_016820 [Coccidioides immitis]|nr:hypothetical protein DIZ76_016820 [Coccidioides immitis]